MVGAERADTALQTLFDAAKLAFERAYAPYSKFSVGAAILSEGDPARGMIDALNDAGHGGASRASGLGSRGKPEAHERGEGEKSQ